MFLTVLLRGRLTVCSACEVWGAIGAVPSTSLKEARIGHPLFLSAPVTGDRSSSHFNKWQPGKITRTRRLNSLLLHSVHFCFLDRSPVLQKSGCILAHLIIFTSILDVSASFHTICHFWPVKEMAK
jgi:hypothetical protein